MKNLDELPHAIAEHPADRYLSAVTLLFRLLGHFAIRFALRPIDTRKKWNELTRDLVAWLEEHGEFCANFELQVDDVLDHRETVQSYLLAWDPDMWELLREENRREWRFSLMRMLRERSSGIASPNAIAPSREPNAPAISQSLHWADDIRGRRTGFDWRDDDYSEDDRSPRRHRVRAPKRQSGPPRLQRSNKRMRIPPPRG